MPLYATRADVVMAAGGERRLLELADYDGDSAEDSGVVDDSIDEAEGLINSYVRRRYEVPLSPVPESIRRATANHALYVLKMRRRALIDSDVVEHDARIEWLKDLAAGRVDPGINPSPTNSPLNSPRYSDRNSSVKAVSRKNFEGFS